MTEQKQAELIAAACKEVGLDGHIKWIEVKKQAQTWAERMAIRFKGGRPLPVKNSYMYCDTLDMCFFYDEGGRPGMTYVGYTMADSPDITEGKLLEAFRRARQLLSTMRELAEEAQHDISE